MVHAAAFLLWTGVPPFAPPSLATRSEAARSGGALVALNLATPAPLHIPPPPRPLPAPPEVEVRRTLEAPVSLSLASARALEGLRLQRSGSGHGPEPDGGSGAEHLTAPVPRSLVPQWDPPADVRGMRVTVRVHVDALGRPTGEVWLDPPTPDRRFNRLLVRKVRGMRYHPARRNGRPVDGWAEITFVF